MTTERERARHILGHRYRITKLERLQELMQRYAPTHVLATDHGLSVAEANERRAENIERIRSHLRRVHHAQA